MLGTNHCDTNAGLFSTVHTDNSVRRDEQDNKSQVCSSCQSSIAVNCQEVFIETSPRNVWNFLSEVSNLAIVHVPIYHVEVLEDNKTDNLRIVRWIQHADWGRRKKHDEIITTAVFHSVKNTGYIDNISIQRVDQSSEMMHFSHRFSVEPAGGVSPAGGCMLRETELLQTHSYQIAACQSNTASMHVLLFANIKRILEQQAAQHGDGSADLSVAKGPLGLSAKDCAETVTTME